MVRDRSARPRPSFTYRTGLTDAGRGSSTRDRSTNSAIRRRREHRRRDVPRGERGSIGLDRGGGAVASPDLDEQVSHGCRRHAGDRGRELVGSRFRIGVEDGEPSLGRLKRSGGRVGPGGLAHAGLLAHRRATVGLPAQRVMTNLHHQAVSGSPGPTGRRVGYRVRSGTLSDLEGFLSAGVPPRLAHLLSGARYLRRQLVHHGVGVGRD